MPTGLSNEKFRRPSIAFQDILRKGSGGLYREKGEYAAFMFRALVIAVDTQGGKLETPTGKTQTQSGGKWIDEDKNMIQLVQGNGGPPLASYEITPTLGPVNPPNSIRARIISSNMDQFLSDDELRCYWPMYPGAQAPSPGEQAYVVFEDESFTHGLWIAKVTTNDADETANQVLRSKTLAEASATKKTLYPDVNQQPAAPGAPPVKKDPQRLTKMFNSR